MILLIATATPKKEEEPSAFMGGLHGVLDVVGMIPIVGDGNIHEGRFTYLDEQTTLFESIDGVTRYTHRDGLVLREINPLGGEAHWQYNEYNELVAETNPLGQTTRYGYDEGGNRTWTQFADGSRVQSDYDEFDRLVSFTDERGSTWRLTYNQQRLTEVQLDSLGAETHYEYDERGRLISVTDALGQTTRLRYDEQHQLLHVVTSDEQIRSRSYDALGRIVTQTDSAGDVERRYYDRLGQLVRTVGPDGVQRTLTYDGLGNVIVAQQGSQLIEFSYDGQDRLTKRQEVGRQIAFSYDKEGRLTGLVNEAGQHYRYGLDSIGQVVEEEGFDGLLRRYERDAAGQITRILRPADRSTEFNYTATGQIAQVRYSDGTAEDFLYDEAGVLIRAENATTVVRLERDELGRVRRESQGEHWIEYEYDALDQRTQLRSSLGADIALKHDAAGNMSEMAAGSWQAKLNYDSQGLEIQRTLSGNVRMDWQRDALGRPTQQRVTAGGPVTRQRTYQWQAGYSLQQIKDSLTGDSLYEHDVYGVLTKAQFSDGSQEIRLPDMVGNLYESEAKDDRHYVPGGQLLNSVQASYEYDAEGNLSQKRTHKGEVWHYEWAGNGMLVSVLRPDGQRVSFTYDALGRRTSKQYKGKTTHWVWEGDKPLHEWVELGLNGQNTEEVITWLFEEDSYAPIGKLQGTIQQSILTDHLGTPLEMINQTGERTWAAQTTAYGRIRLSEGKRDECPFRFQGQYEDVETGLYYNRFRYYAPAEGMYISQDPIGLLGGHVLYGYVDDTTTEFDPFGETNWGAHLKKLIGKGPPKTMKRPHAHHIVFKEGRGKEMKKVLADSKAILEKHGIDWLKGKENLVWAPNKNHSIKAAKTVRDALQKADQLPNAKKEVIKALKEMGKRFANGTICK